MSHHESGHAPHPDLIRVPGTGEREVEAEAAILQLVVEGGSFFFGHEALEKARELQELVTELKGFGIDEGKISLESAESVATGGFLSRSTSARYVLKVEMTTDQLSQHFDELSRRSTLKMRMERWLFGDTRALEDELLTEAAERARDRAKRLAESLGALLGPLHRLDEDVDSSPAVMAPGGFGAGGSFRTSKMTRGGDAVELPTHHTKTLRRSVQAVFHIHSARDDS